VGGGGGREERLLCALTPSTGLLAEISLPTQAQNRLDLGLAMTFVECRATWTDAAFLCTVVDALV
jgi:hypothetical protein